MIIERKFGELKDGEKFWASRESAGNTNVLRIKKLSSDGNNKYANYNNNYGFLSDDSIVFQLITREEQIAALKSIEKPFGLWKPEWLKTCEVFEELKNKEVWEWYTMTKTWSVSWKFCDDGTPYRLSPTYQDPPKETEKPKPTKQTITLEVEDGKVTKVTLNS